MNCWEIQGSREHVLDGLQRLCSAHTGLTFASSSHANGKYEATVDLYEPNKYPFGYIGPAKYCWSPENDRVIRIWTHPSILETVRQQLESVFGQDQQPQAKKTKLTDITQPDEEVLQTESISIKLFKNSFNRFKLLGPLSTTILASILKTIDVRERGTSVLDG